MYEIQRVMVIKINLVYLKILWTHNSNHNLYYSGIKENIELTLNKNK